MGPGLKIFHWQFAALGDSIVQQRSVAELAVGRFERRASFDKILITLRKGSLVEVVGLLEGLWQGSLLYTSYKGTSRSALFRGVNEKTRC